MSFPPPTEGQARIIWASLTGLAIALILALIVLAGWGLGRVLNALGPVLWPIGVAGIIAYLLDPVVDAIERRDVPRARAIFCVFALALVIVLAIVSSVVPQMVRETRELAERIPIYAASLQHRVETWVNHPPALLRKFFKSSAPSPTDTNAPAISATNAISSQPGTAAGSTPRPVTIDWENLLGGESVKSATEWLAKSVGRTARWLFGRVTI